jgi:hypothetical protein
MFHYNDAKPRTKAPEAPKEIHFSEQRPDIVTAAEAGEVIDVNKKPEILHSLDILTQLPFAAKLYKISPNIDDYILISVPICPSDLPNRNGIGFPLDELTKFHPPPINRMSYKAWVGCPLHYDHKNEIHEDAYGIVLDATMHKVTGYGKGKLWKVMGLAALDKTKYPKMAQRVLDNDINTYSMGAMVDAFSCSYCKEPMTEQSYCSHVHPKNDIDWQQVRGHDNSNHVAFRNAHGISPIELSLVESPAWTTALSDNILTR